MRKVNSIQEASAKCFAVHIIKFEILQTTWKNKAKNIKMLNLLVKNWKLRVWCSLFLWFDMFQILLCKPKSIWRKLLVLSWLWLLFFSSRVNQSWFLNLKKMFMLSFWRATNQLFLVKLWVNQRDFYCLFCLFILISIENLHVKVS